MQVTEGLESVDDELGGGRTEVMIGNINTIVSVEIFVPVSSSREATDVSAARKKEQPSTVRAAAVGLYRPLTLDEGKAFHLAMTTGIV